MKTNNYFLHIILTTLLCFAGTKTYAHDIAVENADGVTIYYVYTNNTELAVSYRGTSINNYTSEYYGDVSIPESVTYNGITYSVTSIGSYAFYDCYGLISVTIPNSVTSIGDYVFNGSTGLTSISVDETNTAYKSVDGVLMSKDETTLITYPAGKTLRAYTIPNSVTSIGEYAFYKCFGLTSVTIPNSVTSIGKGAFQGCKLTSATIPNSVTSIGASVFRGCTGLTSVTIPNSVTSIGSYAFYDCYSLISVTIPNSVTSIGASVFRGCTGLTSVTIGNSLTSIGVEVFRDCTSLINVISKMENPCTIDPNCFTNNVFYNSTLYVPHGTTNKYKSTNYWSKFEFIEEGDPSGIAQIHANAVLIQANDGLVSISGLGDSERIAIYQTDGKQVATAKAYNGNASVATNISKGTPVIVKIGEKAVKVVMQ